MAFRVRGVGAVVGVEDEQRFPPVQLSRLVAPEHVADQHPPALQGMRHHQQVEQQNGQRVEVRVDSGQRFAAHDLRSHEPLGAADPDTSLPVDRDVVVVGDQTSPDSGR